MATIFSKIINGDIPSYKVAEDSDHYAFLDINPVQKYHTLVVPKKEVDYIFDMEPNELASLTEFAQTVAAKIKKATGCRKVAMIVLGLEVPHAHIHLIPMNSEADVNFKNKIELTQEEFKSIAEELASI